MFVNRYCLHEHARTQRIPREFFAYMRLSSGPNDEHSQDDLFTCLPAGVMRLRDYLSVHFIQEMYTRMLLYNR